MLNNIKSIYVLKRIFAHAPKRVYLGLIYHNKNFQKKLNISIDNYFIYSQQIEIEIIPTKDELNYDDEEENEFIHIMEEKDRPFYHIYFDGGREEKKRNYIKVNDNITKIKVLIDIEVKSITELFNGCYCVKEIKFVKFNRTDFTDYQLMFNSCRNLIIII